MSSDQEAKGVFGDRYRLLELVGEGSSARVYMAEDLTLRRRVALKILRADAAGDPRFGKRFAEEMRATAVLSHPRVLPVYDWGLDPQPHTVTEYLAGGSLAAVLSDGRLLTPSQALMLGLEAARALVNIHKGGRAHLGLTPASILFDSDARPYISDLGLAAVLGAAARASEGADDSGPSSPVDTAPAAASPVDVGAGAADEADADVGAAGAGYSVVEQSRDIHDLALILCEAVTGTPNPVDDVDDSDPAPVTALDPLQELLERAASADPAERPTAAELASELLRIAPLLSRPDPLPLALPKPPSAVAGLMHAGRAGAFEEVGPTVSELSAIPHDDVRRRWPGLALAASLVLGGAAAGVWAWVSSSSDTSVPELQGRPRAAAAAVAADSGWEVNEILVRAPGTERGEVVLTEPPAGARLGEGDALDVFVSLGEPLIPVAGLDAVYGMTVEDAVDELAAVGLDVEGETLAHNDVVPAGNVVGIDVAEGIYELEPGSSVALLVSEGQANRTVPAVPESREPDEAADALGALQMGALIVTGFSADVPAGAVIGFRPASGSEVPVDSTVEVVVSLGPDPAGLEEDGGGEGAGPETQEPEG